MTTYDFLTVKRCFLIQKKPQHNVGKKQAVKEKVMYWFLQAIPRGACSPLGAEGVGTSSRGQPSGNGQTVEWSE